MKKSRINQFIVNILNMDGVPSSFRRWYLNEMGHKVTKIFPYCKFNFGGGRLTMGGGSYCNCGCFFDLSSDFCIGDNTSVAMGVTFVTSTHMVGDSTLRAKSIIRKPVTIGNGCWIGANVTILPGVTIGDGVVVGAQSLVTKDLPANAIYIGSPAKIYKRLE